MNAYVNTFYVNDGGGAGHYSSTPATIGTAPAPFWNQAEQIEATEDAAERNPEYVSLVNALLTGFVAQYGNAWTANDSYNDDMMWATLAFVRGYDLTSDRNYLMLAKSNFDAAYARGLDASNGGLYETTSDSYEVAAVEGSASLAAAYLASRLSDPTYQQKSASIFAFELATYYDPSTGGVYDDATPGTSDHVYTTYNQGTFIEAALLNGHPTEATATANHLLTMGQTTSASGGYDIMPSYQARNDWGFNAIGLRWLHAFAVGQGELGTYGPWIAANASAAYAVRNANGNSWQDWFASTPANAQLQSWNCVSALEAAQI